ncbi:MAG: cobyric acid synthase [Pseudomonadota bacterium]
MLQGTGSNVGKSVLSAGLCRAFVRRGLRVLPFKPQNMSNNAAVTEDGGEIGRAQALQARACRVPPRIDMNPVLLKPETDTGAQVVVQGKRWATLRAREYGARKHELMAPVLDSYERLARDCDLIVVEGAGSPAEINLRAGDIANMGFAEAADVPVILVGDIDRGGVIASVVGTHTVLPQGERDRIRAFVVNRFRGDPRLFDDGERAIAEFTGWPSLGVVPWFADARHLPAEDALDLARPTEAGGDIRIGVLVFGRIANFDDLDPLRLDPRVDLRLIHPGDPLPADLHLVILPGSKSTIGDLKALRAAGWDAGLQAHTARGGRVLGLCGGYQMLGTTISDPDGLEGAAGSVTGLGLLDVTTTLLPDKATRPVSGTFTATGDPVEGYEIHLGVTEGPDCARPVFDLAGRPDGAQSADGRVVGTYVHGLFAQDAFRDAYLARFASSIAARVGYEAVVDETLDRLADHLEQSLDVDRILEIANSR